MAHAITLDHGQALLLRRILREYEATMKDAVALAVEEKHYSRAESGVETLRNTETLSRLVRLSLDGGAQ